MKEGKSSSTGHMVKFVPKLNKEPLMNQWNPKTRSFDKVERTYAYCTDCKQYAWGWESLCPMNVKLVTYQKLVVN